MEDDLISRSLLLKEAEDWLCDSTDLRCFTNLIEIIPAVDAEPVRHGRWEWKNGKEFCSVCKKQNEPKRHFEDGTVEEYDYCPNCGAKMDKGVQNDQN